MYLLRNFFIASSGLSFIMLSNLFLNSSLADSTNNLYVFARRLPLFPWPSSYSSSYSWSSSTSSLDTTYLSLISRMIRTLLPSIPRTLSIFCRVLSYSSTLGDLIEISTCACFLMVSMICNTLTFISVVLMLGVIFIRLVLDRLFRTISQHNVLSYLFFITLSV
jgi:hypothetical protein